MSGRIRTIKPEWLEDELLAAASDEARVLSVALLLMADDYGRGRASPAAIAAGAWRYQLEKDDGEHTREILARASRALRELAELRFVTLYEVSGQRYYAIRTWSKHQKVDRPSKPRIPEPPEESRAETSAITASCAHSTNTREDSSSVSREPRQPLATDLRSPTSTSDLRPASVSGARAHEAEMGPSPSGAAMVKRAEAAARYLAGEWKRRTGHTPAEFAVGVDMATTAKLAGLPDRPALDGIVERFFADPKMREPRVAFSARWLLTNPLQWSDAAASTGRDEGAPRERPAVQEMPPWAAGGGS